MLSDQQSINSALAKLPPAFLNRLRAIVPADQWGSTLEGFQRPVPTCFRVNRLKAGVGPVLQELANLGIATEAVPWREDSFVIADAQRSLLTNSAAFVEGRIYIQNLSSIFAAQALDAQPGEEILDLAAAPGGKTLVLAAAMDNRGRLAAVEAVKSRFFRLKNNVELHGAGELVQCYLKDGREVGYKVPERFDRVLLDAPCSSESRFYTEEPESYKYWSEKKVKEMQRKQKKLLRSALMALKPGGVMVYSTCSYSPEENEVVVDRELKRMAGQLQVLPIELPFDNYQPGLTAWGKKAFDPQLLNAVRILPSDTMEGFFLCVLKKADA